MLNKNPFKIAALIAIIILMTPFSVFSQKVAFISSDIIRKKFPEAALADQRVNSFIEEWSRELEAYDKRINDAEFEIRKNRLVWSDEEKTRKEQELENLRRERETFKKQKYQPNGEYDVLVKNILTPVDEKIYAAVQQVAADEGYDLILDKSVQPIPYCNYKYDLTVKILRKLDVNVEELEKEMQEKIDKDPRNEKKESIEPPSKRSRTRSVKTTQEKQDLNKEAPDSNIQQDDQKNKIDTLQPQRPIPR